MPEFHQCHAIFGQIEKNKFEFSISRRQNTHKNEIKTFEIVKTVICFDFKQYQNRKQSDEL